MTYIRVGESVTFNASKVHVTPKGPVNYSVKKNNVESLIDNILIGLNKKTKTNELAEFTQVFTQFAISILAFNINPKAYSEMGDLLTEWKTVTDKFASLSSPEPKCNQLKSDWIPFSQFVAGQILKNKSN